MEIRINKDKSTFDLLNLNSLMLAGIMEMIKNAKNMGEMESIKDSFMKQILGIDPNKGDEEEEDEGAGTEEEQEMRKAMKHEKIASLVMAMTAKYLFTHFKLKRDELAAFMEANQDKHSEMAKTMRAFNQQHCDCEECSANRIADQMLASINDDGEDKDKQQPPTCGEGG